MLTVRSLSFGTSSATKRTFRVNFTSGCYADSVAVGFERMDARSWDPYDKRRILQNRGNFARTLTECNRNRCRCQICGGRNTNLKNPKCISYPTSEACKICGGKRHERRR
jgi:hypothetical protein